MRLAIIAAATLALAACGVAGPPERPAPKAETGVTISGSVSVGVTGR